MEIVFTIMKMGGWTGTSVSHLASEIQREILVLYRVTQSPARYKHKLEIELELYRQNIVICRLLLLV